MARPGVTSPASRVVLGPFALETRIGEGGMGEVWRARHVSQGVSVAVKVLTAEGSSRPMFVDSFRNEVRAVAALDHPHIVRVLDYGSVSDQASRRSGGRLVAGTPYLSMELVEGGTLADHMGTLPWTEIERILRCLLDALAHAHARGVVHRDLKLSNVLYDPDAGSVKLTDFGIAHAMAATGDPFRWGTPAYMPPEQLLGRWWEYGPWSDLYSLGCCAVALVTGHRAFPNDALTPDARELGPLAPRMMVPSGLEGWLQTLTAPDPHRRHRLAADAAWALRQVAGSAAIPGTAARTRAPEFPEYTVALPFLDQAAEFTASSAARFEDVPPMPEYWAPSVERPASPPLHGAGLGLVGLRRPPLVGRVAERTALWNALREVRDTGETRVVLVRGPSGCGKSRLADWLGERAHETGAAWVMRAIHSPDDDPAEVLGAMVGRFLRVGGLGAVQVRQRIAVALDVDPRHSDVNVLMHAILPDATGAAATSDQRVPALRRFVAHHAEVRPGLLLFDDVQWGRASVELVSALDEPVLAVLVVGDEGLAEQPAVRALIDTLMRARDGEVISLGPLSPVAHRELVQALLGLDSTLTRLVEERTQGNPMFAVQLVGDWVEREVLEPGERGFSLRDGSEVPLPDDLFAVWGDRIDDLLSGRPMEDRHALEIAALLGPRVLRREWIGACRARGFDPSDELVDDLLARRLVSLDRAGDSGSWWFGPAMLREALERQAEESGRAPSHHRACAAMLEASGPSAHARMARHLLYAGAADRAVGAAVRALRVACDAADVDRAYAMMELWSQAITSLVLPEGDVRWAEGLALCGRVHLATGRHDDAHGVAQRLQAGVDQYEWPAVWGGWARWMRGVLAAREGRPSDAAAHFEELGEAEPAVERWSQLARGDALLALGALTGAEAAFRAALDLAHRASRDDDVGLAWIGLAEVAWCEGELERARQCAVRARDAFRAGQYPAGAARVAEVTAAVARAEGSWDEARAMARSAADQWAGRGAAVDAVRAEVAVAIAAVLQDDPEPLDQLLGRAERLGLVSATVHLLIAKAVASTDARETCSVLLERARDILTTAQLVSPDVARAAEAIASDAARRGWVDLAGRATELAIAQWMWLGRQDDADRAQLENER